MKTAALTKTEESIVSGPVYLVEVAVGSGAAASVGTAVGVRGEADSAIRRASALAAGADGFLEKPLESLAAFCAALGAFLPDLAGESLRDEALRPDPLALRDDLARAASRLETLPDGAARRYVTGFVAGVARHAHDTALARAASEAGQNPDLALDGLRHLIDRRLAHADAGFSPAAPACTTKGNTSMADPGKQALYDPATMLGFSPTCTLKLISKSFSSTCSENSIFTRP